MSFRLISSLALCLTIGLTALEARSGGVFNPSTAVISGETRNISYLLGNDSYVMATLYDAAQYKTVQNLIGQYKMAMWDHMDNIEKTGTEYKTALKDAASTPESLKPLFQAYANAEAGMEVLDFKLHLDLWNLLTDAQKPVLAETRARVNALRHLLVDADDGDKTLYQCAGDIDPMVGFVGTVMTDAQFETAKEIIAKNNKSREEVQKKMGLALHVFHHTSADMNLVAGSVEKSYMEYRDAAFDYFTLTRKRDFDLLALLNAEQRVALEKKEKRVRSYLKKFTGGSFMSRESQDENAETRNTMYIRGYNGGMVIARYDDAQWATAKALVETYKSETRPMWDNQSRARDAYAKAVVDPAISTEALRPLFDAVSRAEAALHERDWKLEVDLKALLTDAQKEYIKANKKRLKSYRLAIWRYDDSLNGCCGGGAEAAVGMVVNVYKDNQYDTAMGLIKKFNEAMSPLLGSINKQTQAYEKMLTSPSNTIAQVESAFLGIRDLRFQHAMVGRERNMALADLLNAEQNAALEKLVTRFREFKGTMEKP